MAARYRIEKSVRELCYHFDLVWDEDGRVVRVGFNEDSITPLGEQPPYGVAAMARELRCFLQDGEPLTPLHWSLFNLESISEFSKKVYDATLHIPHGETRTYAWVAKRIGKPLAARAVGQALRRNPFPIFVPCHRVVSDKSLGGFMGCDQPNDFEMRFKSWLLDLERCYRNPPFAFLSAVPTLTSC